MPLLVQMVSGLDLKDPRNFAPYFATLSPTRGVEAINQGKKGNNLGIIPRMERFHGPVEKG